MQFSILDALMRGIYEAPFSVADVRKSGDFGLGTVDGLDGEMIGLDGTFYKILPDEILVAHDEIDLPPGTIRLKLGGGIAGHNGLRDIASVLGTPEFWRMRIGVGHPRTLQLQQQVMDFVLHPPRRDEQKLIDEAIERGMDVLPQMFDGQTEAAMMRLHTVAG